MTAIDLIWQYNAPEIVIIKKTGMLGSKLNCIPEKRKSGSCHYQKDKGQIYKILWFYFLMFFHLDCIESIPVGFFICSTVNSVNDSSRVKMPADTKEYNKDNLREITIIHICINPLRL